MKKSLLLLFILSFWVAGTKAQNLRISGSNGHSVIICSNGNVFAWGKNSEGQIGLDINGDPYPDAYYTEPQRVYGLSEIFQIDAGSGGHTLALTCNGKVNAWGRNDYGQLGDGNTAGVQATPVFVEGGETGMGELSGVSYVSGGNDESFAILETGELVAWGQNDKGQLGDGTTIDRVAPVYVRTNSTTTLQNVIMVEAGDENGYALADPDGDGVGTVYSWGDNADNNGLALGRDPATNPRYAQPVVKENGDPLDNIVAISAGDRHCLAIDADGWLWAWGGDWGHGQVGDGYNTGGYYTQEFATRVVAGELASDPTMWKTEYLGGPADADGKATNPVVSIAAGQAHSIASLADGTVVTWGSNGFFNCGNGCSTPAGQLGAGTTRFTTDASYTDADGANTAPVVGVTCDGNPLTNVVEVSDGDAWTFALTGDDRIFVAGFNENGELGIGNTTNQFCFTELEIPNCGITAPCPKPNLGPDFQACPGFTKILSAGNIYAGFQVRWYKDGVGIDTVDVTVPQEVTYEADSFGVWHVEVEDLRPATDRPCEPCDLASDTIEITEWPVPFDLDSLFWCKNNLMASVDGAGEYDWYTEKTGGVLVGSTVASDTAYFDPADLTEYDASTKTYTIYVEDATIFETTTGITSTAGLTNPDNNGGQGNSSYLEFDILKPVTVEAITVKVKTWDCGNIDFDITDLSTGTVMKSVSYTSTTACGTGGTFVEMRVPVDVELPVGSYSIQQTGGESIEVWDGGFTFPQSYDDIITYTDNHSTYNEFNKPNHLPGWYSWEVKSGSDYPCGRVAVEVPESCPPCQPPSTLRLTQRGVIDICVGDELTLDTTNVTLGMPESGNYYYQWIREVDGVITEDPATPALLSTYSTINIDPVTLADSAKYKIRILDGTTIDAACYREDSVYVNVHELPDAMILNTGDSLKYCSGEDGVTLYADPIVDATYTWYLDGVEQTGSTGDEYLEAVAGEWTVVVTTLAGCKDSSIAVTVEERPLPDAPVATANPNPVCEGDTLELTATMGTPGSYTFRWSGPSGFVSSSQDTSRAITGSTMEGLYYVFATLDGCEGPGGDVDVTVNPKPATPVIADVDPICAGEELNLSTGSVAGGTYNWSGPDSYSRNGNTVADQSPQVSASATTDMAGDYELYVTVNGCNSDTSSVTVEVNALPAAPTVTGESTVCENEQGVEYSVSNTVGSSYEWIVPTTSGATIASGQGGNTVEINFGGSDLQIKVVETTAAGCESDTGRFNVTVTPSTSVSVSLGGDDQICAGSPGSYTATPTGGGTNPQYQWYYNNTEEGALTTSNTFNKASGLQDGDVISVKLIPDVACPIDTPATADLTVTVVSNLTPSVTINDPGTICAGSPADFTATATGTGGSATYQWQVNGVDAGTDSPNFSPSNLADGDEVRVYIDISSSCATVDNDTSNVVTVQVDAQPDAATINETNPLLTCIDCETLSSATVTTGTISWAILSGPGTLTDNTDGTAEVCDLAPGQTTQVELTVGNGVCDANTATIDIQRTSALSTPDAGTDQTICQSSDPSDVVTLTGSPITGTETGTWSNGDGITITQTGLNGEVAVTDLSVGENIFTYTVENTANCTAQDQVSIFVDEDPGTPVLADDTITTCAESIQLNATDPSPFTGEWIKNSGQGTVTDINDPVSDITGLTSTGYSELIWSVKNGVCPAGKDTVIIEKLGNVTTPVITLDGGEYSMVDVTNDSKELCISNSYDIIGNGPASGETATWTIVSGTSVVVTEDGTENQTLSLIEGGETILEWKIERSLAGCPPATGTVTLDVKALPAQPSTIDGETDVCEGSEGLYYQLSAPLPGVVYSWTSSDVTLVGPTDGTGVIVDVPNGAPNPSVIEVVATNSCGASTPQTISINVNPNEKPVVTISSDLSEVCEGEDVTFSAVSTDEGNATFVDYVWYVNGQVKGTGTPLVVNDLLPGNTVYAEGYYEGCIDNSILNFNDAVESNSLNIDVIRRPKVTINTDAEPSTDICDGAEVTFTAEGEFLGSSPDYVWYVDDIEVDNGSNTYQSTTLTDGAEVKVIVESDAQCADEPAKDSITMTVHPNVPVSVDISPIDDDICVGDPMPTYTATPAGEGDNPVYTWTINGAVEAISNTPEFNPTSRGPSSNGVPYTVQVELQSSERCTTPADGKAVASTSLTVNPKPDSKIDGNSIYCPGETLTLSAEPIGSDYTYTWLKDGSDIVPAETGQTLTVGEDGDYQVLVTNSVTGCEKKSAVQIVYELPFGDLDVVSNKLQDTKCEEDPITLTATSVHPDYTYEWIDPSGNTLAETQSQITVTDPGVYELIYHVSTGSTGPGSCPYTTNIEVFDLERPEPVIPQPDSTFCEGMTYTVEVADANGNPADYTWYRNEEVLSYNNTFLVTESGQYIVVGDNGSCINSDTVNVVVEVNPVAEAGPDQYIRDTELAELTGSKSKDAYSFEWYSFTYDSTIVEVNESDVIVGPKETSLFYLTVASPSGYCEHTDSMIVHVEQDVKVWNSFSPNGDGLYDTWIIENLEEYPNALIEVYNRWGTLVWKSTGYSKPWDGTNFRNGQLLPIATYYYIIYPNGGTVNEPLTGPVTIVK